MPQKTIALHPDTHAALSLYRVSGLTFDDVLQRLMENHPVEDFHREYLEWQRETVAKLKKSRKVKPLKVPVLPRSR